MYVDEVVSANGVIINQRIHKREVVMMGDMVKDIKNVSPGPQLGVFINYFNCFLVRYLFLSAS
jgi:hypothetical protein